jgi:hypothetical protein
MPQPTTSFKVKGPVFKPDSQVSNKMTAVVNRGLLEMATIEGSNQVKEQLYPTHGEVTGTLRRSISAGKVRDYLVQIDAGELMYGANLIYSNWVEGIGSRNATSTFKGYGMFKKAYEHLDNNPRLYQKYIGDAVLEAFK